MIDEVKAYSYLLRAIRFIYDLRGSAVTTANRMEEHGMPGPPARTLQELRDRPQCLNYNHVS